MRLHHCFVGLFLVLLLLAPPALGQTPPDGHTIEGDLMHPESVAYDATNEVFYAANVGKKLAPSAKDGDGFISRLSANGNVETLRFLPASDDAVLNAPKGTVVIDGRLYTADIDRVVGFDLDTREQIADISLADKGVTFLNDIAVMDEQTLFASGSSQGTIYRVDLAAGTATALDVDVPGANGLAYVASEGVLFAVTFGGEQGGKLWTLELDGDGAVTDASARTLVEKGRFDGVVVRPDEQILISDWGVDGASNPTPALHRVAEAGTGPVTTMELPDWQGPADFSCAPTRGCWIPDLPGNFVEIVRSAARTE